jgi:tetratricopeptide (TPR) repeat protein
VRQAVADYMQVLEREPNNPEHYKDLGIILQKAGRVKDALSYYDKGLALDPYDPALYNNRGLIRAGQSDLDGALSDFTQAIRLNPKQYRYYVTRGDLRQLQEDTAGALRDYATALRYMPVSAPDPAPHIRRAQIFTAQDKKDAALAEWQAALRIAPDNTEIQSALSALTATDISR